jgi:hypothetical protein
MVLGSASNECKQAAGIIYKTSPYWLHIETNCLPVRSSVMKRRLRPKGVRKLCVRYIKSLRGTGIKVPLGTYIEGPSYGVSFGYCFKQYFGMIRFICTHLRIFSRCSVWKNPVRSRFGTGLANRPMLNTGLCQCPGLASVLYAAYLVQQ